MTHAESSEVGLHRPRHQLSLSTPKPAEASWQPQVLQPKVIFPPEAAQFSRLAVLGWRIACMSV